MPEGGLETGEGCRGIYQPPACPPTSFSSPQQPSPASSSPRQHSPPSSTPSDIFQQPPARPRLGKYAAQIRPVWDSTRCRRSEMLGFSNQFYTENVSLGHILEHVFVVKDTPNPRNFQHCGGRIEGPAQCSGYSRVWGPPA